MKLVHNKKTLKKIRTKLRNSMPLPEVTLWQHIRNKQLGTKFRRQYSIGDYVLDFYAPAIKLGIEIDGESHFVDQDTQKKDATRDNNLQKEGIKVMRFLNTEIMTNQAGCVQKVLEIISNN